MLTTLTEAQSCVHAYLRGRLMDEHLLSAAIDVVACRLRAGLRPVLTDWFCEDLDNQAVTALEPPHRPRERLVNEQAMQSTGWADVKAPAHHSSRSAHRVLVFVIDDHPIMRDVVVSVIRRLSPDARIHEFGCLGELPSATTLPHPPAAVVLDLKLPGAVGCSGVVHVRGCYPSTPLAVCSASPASDMAAQCLDAGANLYIEKGSGSLQLTDALKALLAMGSNTQRAMQRETALQT